MSDDERRSTIPDTHTHTHILPLSSVVDLPGVSDIPGGTGPRGGAAQGGGQGRRPVQAGRAGD